MMFMTTYKWGLVGHLKFARLIIYFLQIAAIRKTSKFEDEIRMEQEERKREEEEKRKRQQAFKERAALFGGGN